VNTTAGELTAATISEGTTYAVRPVRSVKGCRGSLPSRRGRGVEQGTERVTAVVALVRLTAELEADLWPDERLVGLSESLERLGARQPTGAVRPPGRLRQRRVLALSFLLDAVDSREAFSQGEKLIDAALRDAAVVSSPGVWRVVSVVFPKPDAR
jgi:hypothetical protein